MAFKDALKRLVMKKSYTAFLVGVSFLVFTAFIKAPCPVCDGTGKVSASVGMENVVLLSNNYDLQYFNADFCFGYTLYKYAITLTLTNSGSEAAKGWIKAMLNVYAVGTSLDVQHIRVEIPRGSSVSDTFDVWFTTAFDNPTNVVLEFDVEPAGVTCLACKGTTRLALNAWMLGASLKEKLQQTIRMEQTYIPPPYVTPLPPEGE